MISVFFFCLDTLVGQTRDDVRVSKPIAGPFPFRAVVRLVQRRLQAGFFMLVGTKIPQDICACMYRVVVGGNTDDTVRSLVFTASLLCMK